MSQRIAGVLFDMDGVIVDSERFMSEAAIAMFRERGIHAVASDFAPFVGRGENRYIGGVAEQYGVSIDVPEAKRRTYELFGEIVHGRLQPLPGSIAYLAECRRRGLRVALASSADEPKVRICLAEVGLASGAFDAVLNGLDVVNKKPDPEIYLAAAARLGLDPSVCLVVEDAPAGLEAARAAHARCLMLATTFPRADLEEWGADWIADDLRTAPPEALAW